MLFEDALAEMRLGKNVKRKCWTDSYMFIGKEIDSFKETLYLGIKGSAKLYPVRNVASGCVLGDDWEVVEG